MRSEILFSCSEKKSFNGGPNNELSSCAHRSAYGYSFLLKSTWSLMAKM